ncbi:MAG: hypothetical protein ISS41_07325 [Candidatus Aminicenantes bacterium]|nr:hypothetical protein [Candidatus Aminicenantes bacterium]
MKNLFKHINNFLFIHLKEFFLQGVTVSGVAVTLKKIGCLASLFINGDRSLSPISSVPFFSGSQKRGLFQNCKTIG